MKHIKNPEEFVNESASPTEILKGFKKVSKRILDENVKSEVKRYLYGSKTEFKETGKFFKIGAKHTKNKFVDLFLKHKKGEKLTKEEKKFLYRQSIDILKIVGLVIPFQVLFPIPVPMIGTTILILLEYIFRKMGINILPDAYYADPSNYNKIKKVEDFVEGKVDSSTFFEDSLSFR